MSKSLSIENFVGAGTVCMYTSACLIFILAPGAHMCVRVVAMCVTK